MSVVVPRPGRLRLILFASGDFAFNLYWQSVMTFLLFYYTEAAGLPVTIATTIFFAASVFDGLANFATGVIVDRRDFGVRYGARLMRVSIPLGLAFVLLYLPPYEAGPGGIALVTLAHLMFRAVYAFANVPYLAMSARVSADSDDRALLAGTRMMFGTLAAILVALGTLPVGRWLAGSAAPPSAIYFSTAVALAVAGAAILLAVGTAFRTAPNLPLQPAPRLLPSLRTLAANRAFVTLNLAMAAMIIGVTVLNKSVLYYFKYFLGSVDAGMVAVAGMNIISAVAILPWLMLRRRIGTRLVWQVAAIGTMAGLLLFAILGVSSTLTMQLFLMAIQISMVGLHFAFWAMLPNTVEFGQQRTGMRVEGTAFGVAALVQRVAIGLATAILGAGFGSAGFVANAAQSEATLAAMRWTIIWVPVAFLALSVVVMRLNPLERGAHAAIIRDLAEAPDQPGSSAKVPPTPSA